MAGLLYLHAVSQTRLILTCGLPGGNSSPPWDSEPIDRADLDKWSAIFQAPEASELALFDAPADSRSPVADHPDFSGRP
jgi:hypothetical protein